jgi:hypothetical protein
MYGFSGYIEPLFLDLGVSWRWVVPSRPRRSTSGGRDPGTHGLGLMGPRAHRAARRREHSWPYRHSNSDPLGRPARSQSLYQNKLEIRYAKESISWVDTGPFKHPFHVYLYANDRKSTSNMASGSQSYSLSCKFLITLVTGLCHCMKIVFVPASMLSLVGSHWDNRTLRQELLHAYCIEIN